MHDPRRPRPQERLARPWLDGRYGRRRQDQVEVAVAAVPPISIQTDVQMVMVVMAEGLLVRLWAIAGAGYPVI